MCACQNGYVVHDNNCIPYSGNANPGDSCQQPGIVCIGGASCTEGICACTIGFTPSGSNCIPFNPSPPQYPLQLIPGETCDSRCAFSNNCQQSCTGGSICVDNICTCPIGQYVFGGQCVPQLPPQPTFFPTAFPPSNTIPTARPSEPCDVNTVCIGGATCILGVCQCPPGYVPTADLTSCINNLLVNSGQQTLPLSQRSYPTFACNKTYDCPKNMICDQQICKCSDGYILQDGACYPSLDQTKDYPTAAKDETFEIISNGYPGAQCSKTNRECLLGSSCFVQYEGRQYCACPNKLITNSTGHCTIRLLSDTKESKYQYFFHIESKAKK
uniref:EGF-like domain-containing protein n=1 Tax=Panagrolaimus superbus TaxID=310955 RepID=A0A914XRD5_9BILA